jgi:hypothetical protein
MDLVRAIQERIKAEIHWVKMVTVAPQNTAPQK